MNIKILQMIDGARKATGITVIIDVFRAGSVEAYLANNNAKMIIPMGNIDTAYELKEKYPSAILIGERHGIPPEGFTYGNSPAEIQNVDFTDKTLIHTTSAGTQGIENAINAQEIIFGSLVTAKAIANYIKKNKYEDISLVCMGYEAKEEAEEDNLCAYYIKSLLEGKEVDLKDDIEKLKITSGARFFKKELQNIFHEADFYLSTEVDKFNFILKLETKEEGIRYMKRIDI